MNIGHCCGKEIHVNTLAFCQEPSMIRLQHRGRYTRQGWRFFLLLCTCSMGWISLRGCGVFRIHRWYPWVVCWIFALIQLAPVVEHSYSSHHSIMYHPQAPSSPCPDEPAQEELSAQEIKEKESKPKEDILSWYRLWYKTVSNHNPSLFCSLRWKNGNHFSTQQQRKPMLLAGNLFARAPPQFT